MRPDQLSDERLDEVLRRQRRWEPPPHFGRAVVARIPPPIPGRPSAVPSVMRGGVAGALAASVALVGGLLVSAMAPALIAEATAIAVAYEMFWKAVTVVLVEHATVIAWVSAAISLSIVASVTGWSQDWI
jgi:hypothetical protein